MPTIERTYHASSGKISGHRFYLHVRARVLRAYVALLASTALEHWVATGSAQSAATAHKHWTDLTQSLLKENESSWRLMAGCREQNSWAVLLPANPLTFPSATIWPREFAMTMLEVVHVISLIQARRQCSPKTPPPHNKQSRDSSLDSSLRCFP